MSEFIQRSVAPGEDPRSDTLAKLTGGMPYVMVSILAFREENFDIKLDVGGGIGDLTTIHAFLTRAREAIEIQMLEEGHVPYILDDPIDPTVD